MLHCIHEVGVVRADCGIIGYARVRHFSQFLGRPADHQAAMRHALGLFTPCTDRSSHLRTRISIQPATRLLPRRMRVVQAYRAQADSRLPLRQRLPGENKLFARARRALPRKQVHLRNAAPRMRERPRLRPPGVPQQAKPAFGLRQRQMRDAQAHGHEPAALLDAACPLIIASRALRRPCRRPSSMTQRPAP